MKHAYIKSNSYTDFLALLDIGPFNNTLMQTIAENSSSAEQFLDRIRTLHLTKTDITEIEKATRDQSAGSLWKLIRYGRLTASNFYKVKTRIESKRKDKRTCLDKLIASFTHPRDLSNNPAIKHGREMEEKARAAYAELHKKGHEGSQVEECGIFLSEKHSYLGASPDATIYCDCHGAGVLEIKCPVIQSTPSHENVSFLVKSTDGTKSVLKKNHPYYGQVQGQMEICGVGYCDFFVYASAGHVTYRLYREPHFIQSMFAKLDDFFVNHLCLVFWQQHRLNDEPDSKHVCYSDIETKSLVKS